ncbi:hypothetical protein ACT7DZ_28695 [Bacillus cereus]
MIKSTRSIDGLNGGSVIYDEVEQNLRETLGSCAEARQTFFLQLLMVQGMTFN